MPKSQDFLPEYTYIIDPNPKINFLYCRSTRAGSGGGEREEERGEDKTESVGQQSQRGIRKTLEVIYGKRHYM